MPWIKHRLRDAEVWAKADANGALVTDRDGRVEIVYKPANGAKVYRAGARNLAAVAGSPPVEIEVGAPAPEAPDKGPNKPANTAPDMTSPPGIAVGGKPPADAIHVWTDGACSGNPGPAGLGAVIIDGDDKKELSEYLGEATNNIAE